MNKLIIRWAINAIALFVAIWLVPGIHMQGMTWVSILVLALIFGLVNAVLRPIVKLLTCPLIILTLGFGTLLVNTLMFYLAGQIGQSLGGFGFSVDGFWPAFWGALVVSIVSLILSMIFHDELKHR